MSALGSLLIYSVTADNHFENFLSFYHAPELTEALLRCMLLFLVNFNIFVYIKNNKEMNNSLFIFDPGAATAFLIRKYGRLCAE